MDDRYDQQEQRRIRLLQLSRREGLGRSLFGLRPGAVARRLAEILSVAEAAERELAQARATTAEAAARSEELARQVDAWRGRQEQLDAAYGRIVELEQQAMAAAQERAQRLLDAAEQEAEGLHRQAREIASRIEAEGLAQASSSADQADRLRAFHQELEASIRAALGRFEQALADLSVVDDAPLDGLPGEPRLTLVAAEDTAEPGGPEPSVPSEAAADDAQQEPQVTPDRQDSTPAPSSHRHKVLVRLHPVVDFSHLAGLEESLARQKFVADVHVRSFDGEAATIEAEIPINLSLATLVAEATSGDIHERSPTEVDADLASVLPDRARPVG